MSNKSVTGTLAVYANDKPVANILRGLDPAVLETLSKKVNMPEPVTPMPTAKEFAQTVKDALKKIQEAHASAIRNHTHEKNQTHDNVKPPPASVRNEDNRYLLKPFLDTPGR